MEMENFGAMHGIVAEPAAEESQASSQSMNQAKGDANASPFHFFEQPIYRLCAKSSGKSTEFRNSSSPAAAMMKAGALW
jgi:hypothetical protein